MPRSWKPLRNARPRSPNRCRTTPSGLGRRWRRRWSWRSMPRSWKPLRNGRPTLPNRCRTTPFCPVRRGRRRRACLTRDPWRQCNPLHYICQLRDSTGLAYDAWMGIPEMRKSAPGRRSATFRRRPARRASTVRRHRPCPLRHACYIPARPAARRAWRNW
jgi:hypothetical protein